MKERFKLISAVHSFLVRNGSILLLRRFNTGYEDGNYSVPAGHLDGGEKASDAMVREAFEEIKIKIKLGDLHMVHVMHRKSTEERIDFFFEVKKWKGKIEIGEPNKCDELRWCSFDKLPGNIVPYVKTAMQHYRKNAFFSEFGWKSKSISTHYA